MALGEIMRDARTRKGWTTAQVAEATRMMVQVVEELEREDFRRIAAPIYGRGFIKLYAEHVGLDPEPLIQEFIEIYTGARAPQVARRAVMAVEKAPVAAAAPTPIPADPVAAAPVQPVVPVEEPVLPAAEDDLFAAASRRTAPARKPEVVEDPPRVSPVGVRAVRRPLPPRPAAPEVAPVAPTAAPAVERPRRAAVSVVAGLRRLWGNCGVPAGWFTRRRILLAAATLVGVVVVAYGVRMLLKVTARGAVQGGQSISVPVLPPPGPYVD